MIDPLINRLISEPGLRARLTPWATALARLYTHMDGSYAAVANRSGFVCTGCEDNCCRTHFHHHTLLEAIVLTQALAGLAEHTRVAIAHQARQVAGRSAQLAEDGQPLRLMCPLNTAGRCQLYAQRPMICRLHGIPSIMATPAGLTQRSPGCAQFDACCGATTGALLDRTPLYAAMAELERTLRASLAWQGKLRLTVAEIVVQFEPLAAVLAGKEPA